MFEILTGLGLALPAGLNAYIPLMAIALADRYFGLINLTPPYDVISSPAGLTIIGILLVIEMLADKIPLVDHVNDLINSVIRPSAGALLVMASTDSVESLNPIVAMTVGLLAAGSMHTVKASIRPTVTAVTGGVGNPIISAIEDAIAIALVIIALLAPIIIAGIALAMIVVIFQLVRHSRLRRSGRYQKSRT